MLNHASDGRIRMNEGNIHLRMLPAIHAEDLVSEPLSDGLDFRIMQMRPAETAGRICIQQQIVQSLLTRS